MRHRCMRKTEIQRFSNDVWDQCEGIRFLIAPMFAY